MLSSEDLYLALYQQQIFDWNVSGIYMIYCDLSKKGYIGQSINIRKRLMIHRQLLNRREHFNIHLQRSWINKNPLNFKFLLIDTCERSQLNCKEEFYVTLINRDTLFNLGEVGKSFPKSKEVCENLSRKITGIKRTEETKRKLSESWKHRTQHPQTAETRKKISESNKQYYGEKHSQSTFTEKDVYDMRVLFFQGLSIKQISVIFNRNYNTVRSAIMGENWVRVPFPPNNFQNT